VAHERGEPLIGALLSLTVRDRGGLARRKLPLRDRILHRHQPQRLLLSGLVSRLLGLAAKPSLALLEKLLGRPERRVARRRRRGEENPLAPERRLLRHILFELKPVDEQ